MRFRLLSVLLIFLLLENFQVVDCARNRVAVYAYFSLAIGVILQSAAFVWHRKKRPCRT